MSSVFFWDSVKGEVDLVLICLLGPFLCDVGASYVDSFPFLWFSHLFDCFPLHEEDSFGNMHVSAALELHGFSQNLPCFPIDLWIKVVEEGVSEDDAVLS
jgi:hypothetical protein